MHRLVNTGQAQWDRSVALAIMTLQTIYHAFLKWTSSKTRFGPKKLKKSKPNLETSTRLTRKKNN